MAALPGALIPSALYTPFTEPWEISTLTVWLPQTGEYKANTRDYTHIASLQHW